MQQKLWTKDFTTITLGSVVSMLGNSISGFAMSLFVLDYQDSTLLYAIYIFLYTLPQIAAPVISGPLMDRFSRRRTIYTLDFCSAVLYSSLGIMILLDAFNFGIFATATFLIGCINSIYMVAFESFYPMLITEGNYSKAYSISGTLQTMTAFILPLATVAYKAFGLAPLLVVNSAFFLLAAAFETRISDVEAISKSPAASYSTKAYFTDMKDGVNYLVSEKGLLFVTLYFMVISLVGGCSQVITLPWFKGSFENGEYLYMFVSLFSVAGRSIGTATFLIGCINSIYMVAFESFYPMLITEGNYSKAYSISGTLQTMTAFILPLATVAYKAFGLAPLLVVNSAFFLLAAAFETRISDVEAISKSPAASYSTKAYFTDMKDGVNYLVSEKGLLFVTLYFMVISLVGGCSQVITLPWFKGSFENGEYLYMFVSLFSVAGRSIGGFIHYLIKLPAAKKFSIALFVYVTIALIEAFYLYVPIVPMVIGSFLIGILGVTSYNIRVSATQSYVPNNIKGRFNGAFFMLNTVGTLTGELLSGLLAEFIPMRATLTVFMLFSAVSALVIIGGNKKHIAPIYNRNV